MSDKARVPWLSLVLIGLNMAAAFALFFNAELAFEFGFRPTVPKLAAAVVSPFLHLNLIHLLGNMVFLAAVGPVVEFAAGRAKFLAVYFGGALAGIASHALFVSQFDRDRPLIGASAAIAGCIGYTVVRYMNVRVPLAPRLSVPIWSIASLWVVLQGLGAMIRVGEEGGGTAFWSHLGGFLAGLLLAVVFRAPQEQRQLQDRGLLEAMNDRSPGAAVHAAEKVLRSSPTDLVALRAKAEAHHDMHEVEAEIETRLRILELCPEAEWGDEVDRLLACGGAERLSIRRRAQLAEAIKADNPTAAAGLFESIVSLPDTEPQRPDALLGLAILKQDTQPDRAAHLLQELAEKYGFHGAATVARARGLID